MEDGREENRDSFWAASRRVASHCMGMRERAYALSWYRESGSPRAIFSTEGNLFFQPRLRPYLNSGENNIVQIKVLVASVHSQTQTFYTDQTIIYIKPPQYLSSQNAYRLLFYVSFNRICFRHYDFTIFFHNISNASIIQQS